MNDGSDIIGNELVLPLIYHPLRTRHSSYAKYLMIRNGRAPILIRRILLGNEISLDLVTSGRAWKLPPIVNDIADTLCWLHEEDSPIQLHCIYKSVAVSLIRVCPMHRNHIHPYIACWL